MYLSTFLPGSSPPSPGLAPCEILICNSSAFVRYSMVTPNRPEATCLMADRLLSPFDIGLKRTGSSPPSPVLLFPPSRFMAIATVSWASALIDPKLIAPVQNRLTISFAGSTSSIGMAGPAAPGLNSSSPRSAYRIFASLLIWSAKRLYAFLSPARAAIWMSAIAAGSQPCRSPSARQ